MSTQRTQILERAKRRMLKEGKHAPIVFVETEDGEYVLPVTDTDMWNEDAFGRKKVMFLMGRSLATSESLTHEHLKTLHFAQEMWFVVREPEAAEAVTSASKEPDRREMLGLLELKLNTTEREVTQSFCYAEILRHGGIVDLGAVEEADNPQSDLLRYFLAGVGSAALWDEKELHTRLENAGEDE